MPPTREDEVPLLVDTPVSPGGHVDIGGYTVSFETLPVSGGP
jgi:hypothetical protein